MALSYDPQEVEKKWQDAWENDEIYHAKDPDSASKPDKFYGLVEFPYPSGEGLHVGHPRSYTAIDIMTRKRRMEGKNVLFPMGWDAFGLPTENFAIKHHIRPQEATQKNVANFKRQLQSLGFGFDWSREINTTDPTYYRWTQWMFLQFFNSYYDEKLQKARPITELPQDEREARRMAYKAESTINWCPRCKIGLANEEAQGGVCERCGTKVEQRKKSQWMIRITAYAERLLQDLNTVDYLDKIKTQQINWIGKSEGAYIDFAVSSEKKDLVDKVTVFTTRPDTLFGATYLVLAPEHPLLDTWLQDQVIKNADEVQQYRENARLKSDLERQEFKEKTGVIVQGLTAKNPANGEGVPIWIADYVLAGYGTGSIMAVPAHDERDFAFAKKFDLPIKQVVAHETIAELPFVGAGEAIFSDFLDEKSTQEAKQLMFTWLEQKGLGARATTYRLRDWVFSRQRYWGEPIPIIHCKACGAVPVPESQLPVTLPDVAQYEPTDTGESPLSAIREWVEVACPHCGEQAERETDTMPNWAGSSWYFLRYCDPKNDKTFADKKKLEYWLPVDLYNGGMEHTTLHLLYSRFWYKFLFDLEHIPSSCGAEPYACRRSHAMILGEGGVKMSKSKGNVINPDDEVARYGADVFRTYEMFIGPFDADAPWDTNGIEGVKRFLDKAWKTIDLAIVKDDCILSDDLENILHRTIKKVGDDIDGMHFNTAVSSLMIFVNELNAVLQKNPTIDRFTLESLTRILAPFAPHMCEEIWHTKLGHTTSIHTSGWPSYDAAKLVSATFELVIQVDGKLRDKVSVSTDISEQDAKQLAMNSDKVKPFIEGKEIKKILYVKGRLVSIST